MNFEKIPLRLAEARLGMQAYSKSTCSKLQIMIHFETLRILCAVHLAIHY